MSSVDGVEMNRSPHTLVLKVVELFWDNSMAKFNIDIIKLFLGVCPQEVLHRTLKEQI